ncbi:MAG: 16S rRNA (cytosine(967)-C(5))-methyltransferase RsmB [Proteobacteria bacterium]|nr:16S rRNA (cytosine(967)-C(5))-methyltransferase RsmB [Pseudomonadota bacterium]
MNEYAQVCRLLKRVAEEGHHFDSHFEDDISSSQDVTPFVQQICYGVLRHWYFLDAVTDALSKKPLPDKHLDLRILIMAGLYSIDELNRPAHASVNAAVETTRQLKKAWASGLVNAVLRRYLREKDAITQQVTNDSAEARLNHPAWLIDALARSWPDQGEILQFNNCQAPMTLRVNLLRISRDEYLDLLARQGISARKGQLTDSAVSLDDPMPVAMLPGFSDGLVSIQDEAPQLAAWLLAPAAGDRVLDACAAPGGKTCHLLEQQPDLHLVALDRDRKRIGRITENLERLGFSAEIICSSLEDLDNNRQFERILLDVPCSATGILRRHPDIKLLRTREDVAKLSALQRALLNKALDLLQPGGWLLYSTCSILPEENDAIVNTVVNERDDTFMKSLTLPHETNSRYILQTPVGWQLLPTENEHDGFFYAMLGKRNK